jgi:hypothetical protein
MTYGFSPLGIGLSMISSLLIISSSAGLFRPRHSRQKAACGFVLFTAASLDICSSLAKQARLKPSSVILVASPQVSGHCFNTIAWEVIKTFPG